MCPVRVYCSLEDLLPHAGLATSKHSFSTYHMYAVTCMLSENLQCDQMINCLFELGLYTADKGFATF